MFVRDSKNNIRVLVTLSKKDFKELKNVSSKIGMSYSSFIRVCILKELENLKESRKKTNKRGRQ